MYIDKMIEYLVLADITKNDVIEGKIDFENDYDAGYDLNKLYKRMDELKREFLEPYAINKNNF